MPLAPRHWFPQREEIEFILSEGANPSTIRFLTTMLKVVVDTIKARA